MYTTQQKKELVVKVDDISLIAGQLYKMEPNEILRKYVHEQERQMILKEAHGGATGGHCCNMYLLLPLIFMFHSKIT